MGNPQREEESLASHGDFALPIDTTKSHTFSPDDVDSDSVEDVIRGGVSALTGVPPDELPSISGVDTDALDALFNDGETRPTGYVYIQYDGFDVVIYPDSSVRVVPPEFESVEAE